MECSPANLRLGLVFGATDLQMALNLTGLAIEGFALWSRWPVVQVGHSCVEYQLLPSGDQT